MSTDNERDQHEKLIEWVRDAIARDADLREKYHVQDKFRFVRDRLQTLLEQLEKNLINQAGNKEKKKGFEKSADEVLVYVYLYNAQGAVLRSWSTMLVPKVFYEYSVNRPIYSEQSHIDALLRSKVNKSQHGYLVVAVKSTDVLAVASETKDVLGSPLIKVREGALQFVKLAVFHHNGNDYILNDEGEFIKIND